MTTSVYKKSDHINKNSKFDASFDATDKSLGRLASGVASAILGKSNPRFTRTAIDTYALVSVSNIEKLVLTGKKMDQKLYRYHTQFRGGLKEHIAKNYFKIDIKRAFLRTLSGMLPKNRLRKKLLRNVKFN